MPINDWVSGQFWVLNMNLPTFTLSWVDLVTAVVVLIGIARGRKRGLSEELLDTVQWVIILVAGAFCYRYLGDLLNQKPVLSRLTYHIFSYILIALVIKGIFTLIKKGIGQKLMEGDVFGRGEYYMGMMAGTLRWLCMFLFLLSILHAPSYSADYREQKAKEDAYNYGDISFPTVMSIQDEVFLNSLTGKYAGKYLGVVLMQPQSGQAKNLRDQNSLAKRREREVDSISFGK